MADRGESNRGDSSDIRHLATRARLPTADSRARETDQLGQLIAIRDLRAAARGRELRGLRERVASVDYGTAIARAVTLRSRAAAVRGRSRADRARRQARAAERTDAAADRASAAANRLSSIVRRQVELAAREHLATEARPVAAQPSFAQWELHDHLVQRLYGVGLTVQAAEPLAKQPELRERLEQAVRGIDGVVASLRRFLEECPPRPEAGDPYPLAKGPPEDGTFEPAKSQRTKIET
jgi:hypothetical protein